jgi:hypothetical protein
VVLLAANKDAPAKVAPPQVVIMVTEVVTEEILMEMVAVVAQEDILVMVAVEVHLFVVVDVLLELMQVMVREAVVAVAHMLKDTVQEVAVAVWDYLVKALMEQVDLHLVRLDFVVEVVVLEEDQDLRLLLPLLGVVVVLMVAVAARVQVPEQVRVMVQTEPFVSYGRVPLVNSHQLV